MFNRSIQYEDANRSAPFKAGLTHLDYQLDGFFTLPEGVFSPEIMKLA